MSGNYSLVICPDSASNDYEYHKILKDNGINVLVLDHHLAEYKSENAVIINNQLSDYPNKDLSGVGVVWQFCRYFDELTNESITDRFLDLVALGLTADMMSLLSYETKYLISKGFMKDNIHNPFIEYMLDKNSFPLSKSDYVSAFDSQACTPMGAAFFIVPLLNATTRSGTLEEKKLIFMALLEATAFNLIPEIKRGKATGKQEKLVLQAVRIVGNIKNRQSKAEEIGLTTLEQQIDLNKKVLLFTLPADTSIDAEIRGLIANKLASKYQKPCLILTERDNTYEGSMRGYTKNGLTDFKDIIERCRGVIYCAGHQNAAGVSVNISQIQEFEQDLEYYVSQYPAEPVYRVDYIFNDFNYLEVDKILDIANMNDFWGQDFDRSYVGVRCRVTDSNFTIMKSNTLKITLPNNISIIKFNGTEEDVEKLSTHGYVDIQAYCKCGQNTWQGITYPQLFIQDYEILDSCKYLF